MIIIKLTLPVILVVMYAAPLCADDETVLFTSSLHEGNQGYTGSLGRFIDVKAPIKITEVGAFESNPTGPFVIKIAIFDNDTKELVTGSRIYEINRNNSKLHDKYRFRKIEAITLKPGSYMLVAKGYNNDQQNGNTGHGGAGPGVNGGDRISVLASAFGGESLGYPPTQDGNLYHAANIKFISGDYAEVPPQKASSAILRRRN